MEVNMDEQKQTEEKDTTWKRIKRGFKVLLEKAKSTATAINEKQNSKESQDFFTTDVNQFGSPIIEDSAKPSKETKNPYATDFNGISDLGL